MTSEFTAIEKAKRPEDLFGKLDGAQDAQLAALRMIYRAKARTVHPDLHANATHAKDAFAKLATLNEEAEKRIKAGIYGKKDPTPVDAGPVTITRKGCQIIVDSNLLATGDICNVYRATRIEAGKDETVLLKIARNQSDNDLVQREAAAIQKLVPKGTPDEKFFRYLPRLIDSFKIPDPGHGPRQVNLLALHNDHFSIADIRGAYPNGVLFEDAVWMLNRLLEGLGFVHQHGYVHGAVLPPHVLFHPRDHAARIVDWSYATTTRDTKAPAISTAWKQFYAPEILAKKKPTPASDIYMIARCMNYLLGSDTNDVPLARVDDKARAKAADPFKRFLEICLYQAPHMRPQDAWEMRKNLDDLMHRWYGPRRYHPFSMPTRAA